MYKTFPGTTYPSCIFHESKLELKHINTKIPRSPFFKKGHVSKNTKRPISALPPHGGRPPSLLCSGRSPHTCVPLASVKVWLPSHHPFHLSLLPSFLFIFYPLSLLSPYTPSSFPISISGGTKIIFVLSCLYQGLLLLLLHLTKGAQSCRIENSENDENLE